MISRFWILFILLVSPAGAEENPAAWPPVPRRIPPEGIPIPEEARADLTASLQKYWQSYDEVDHPDKPDAGVFLKAAEFALLHGEFYRETDVELTRELMVRGAMRLQQLAKAKVLGTGVDWGKGLLVRGYESSVDASLQPYGLEIPESLDLDEPVPLLVWLHGRGDKTTDIHFIDRCLSKSQAFQGKDPDQDRWIVLHPFGRQCIGWKHAGEIDVLEAIAEVRRHYPIDPQRILLAGFSMGGAGAWHIGAHYTDRFAAVHAGAGFAETARYNRLEPADYPPSHEQTLWGLYDVPAHARNLLNLPVLVAYSGEEDKQKQAADVMAEVLAEHGHELDHRIGPGMGHRYDDASARSIASTLAAARLEVPDKVEWQGRTLRYPRMHWLRVTGLNRHWEDARVTADRSGGAWTLQTRNVSALELTGPFAPGAMVTLDGQAVSPEDPAEVAAFHRHGGGWAPGAPPAEGLRKRPGLQGPIDDAFNAPFLVVLPSRPSANPRLQRWLDFEIDHFVKRWRALFRGHLRIVRDGELTAEDVEHHHLICFGEPDTHLVLQKALPHLPLTWTSDSVSMGGATKYDASSLLPVLIHPNPLQPDRYLVINSGPTFREDHDRTNSLQNPKLPDWAILDLDVPPDGSAAGRIAEAGFFDETWKPAATP